jgi:hypothetical protein
MCPRVYLIPLENLKTSHWVTRDMGDCPDGNDENEIKELGILPGKTKS